MTDIFANDDDAEDWPGMLGWQEREQAGDNPRVVLDTMAVPGFDPYELPQPDKEPFWWALLGALGVAVAVIGTGALLYGLGG